MIGEPSVLDPLSKEKVSRRLRLDDTKFPAFADSASTATSTMRYAMSVLTSTAVRRGRNHVSDFDHYPGLGAGPVHRPPALGGGHVQNFDRLGLTARGQFRFVGCPF
jgi:hypothetical protein